MCLCFSTCSEVFIAFANLNVGCPVASSCMVSFVYRPTLCIFIIDGFLSPLVQLARRARMHHFASVRPSVCLWQKFRLELNSYLEKYSTEVFTKPVCIKDTQRTVWYICKQLLAIYQIHRWWCMALAGGLISTSSCIFIPRLTLVLCLGHKGAIHELTLRRP